MRILPDRHDKSPNRRNYSVCFSDQRDLCFLNSGTCRFPEQRAFLNSFGPMYHYAFAAECYQDKKEDQGRE